MKHFEESGIERIILHLEKKYPIFKKMDIYQSVKHAWYNTRAIVKELTDSDFERIQRAADDDLRLSLKY